MFMKYGQTQLIKLWYATFKRAVSSLSVLNNGFVGLLGKSKNVALENRQWPLIPNFVNYCQMVVCTLDHGFFRFKPHFVIVA